MSAASSAYEVDIPSLTKTCQCKEDKVSRVTSSSPRDAEDNGTELSVRIDVDSYAHVQSVLYKLLYDSK